MKKGATLIEAENINKRDNLLASDHWGARIVNGKIEVYAKDGTIIKSENEPITSYEQFKTKIQSQPSKVIDRELEIQKESLRIVTELANSPKKKRKWFKKPDSYGGLESAYLQWKIMND